MQYIVLIYEDESVYGPDKAGDATNQVVAGHMAFGQQLGGKRIGGAGLQNTPKATTVRTAADGTKTRTTAPLPKCARPYPFSVIFTLQFDADRCFAVRCNGKRGPGR